MIAAGQHAHIHEASRCARRLQEEEEEEKEEKEQEVQRRVGAPERHGAVNLQSPAPTARKRATSEVAWQARSGRVPRGSCPPISGCASTSFHELCIGARRDTLHMCIEPPYISCSPKPSPAPSSTLVKYPPSLGPALQNNQGR